MLVKQIKTSRKIRKDQKTLTSVSLQILAAMSKVSFLEAGRETENYALFSTNFASFFIFPSFLRP